MASCLRCPHFARCSSSIDVHITHPRRTRRHARFLVLATALESRVPDNRSLSDLLPTRRTNSKVAGVVMELIKGSYAELFRGPVGCVPRRPQTAPSPLLPDSSRQLGRLETIYETFLADGVDFMVWAGLIDPTTRRGPPPTGDGPAGGHRCVPPVNTSWSTCSCPHALPAVRPGAADLHPRRGRRRHRFHWPACRPDRGADRRHSRRLGRRSLYSSPTRRRSANCGWDARPLPGDVDAQAGWCAVNRTAHRAGAWIDFS
jgi:hypothetical protein